jgi:peroxiredoxin
MKNAALFSTIALLPVLAYAPLTSAANNQQLEPPKKMEMKTLKLEEPLALGDKMVNFEIENAAGGTITLDEMLSNGPVVITFYRGSWCPYCVGELTSIQKRIDKITKAGGTVLAISPEIPEKTVDLAEQKDIGFSFGTDHDNKLAKQLALAFKLDPKTIKRYRDYGIDLPESNDSKRWELPVPATYVIDTDHTIRFAYVDEDYSKRADYDDVVSVLKAIQEES